MDKKTQSLLAKKGALRVTLAKFLKSEKGANDYTELLLVASVNAGGLGWEEIAEIVKEAINPTLTAKERKVLKAYLNMPIRVRNGNVECKKGDCWGIWDSIERASHGAKILIAREANG